MCEAKKANLADGNILNCFGSLTKRASPSPNHNQIRMVKNMPASSFLVHLLDASISDVLVFSGILLIVWFAMPRLMGLNSKMRIWAFDEAGLVQGDYEHQPH